MKRFLLVLTLLGMSVWACSGKVNQGDGAGFEPANANVPAPKAGLVEEETLPVSTLNPMDAIKDLDKQIESYHLGQELTTEQLNENTRLKQRIIRGTFDIEELCRLSLDKHWTEIIVEEQKHFVDLMKKLLEKKAIFSKEQLRGENKYYKIQYLKEEFDKNNADRSTVYTRMNILKRSMDLNLTYKLVKKPQGWKIFDVIVDDASLLSNYRFQFDRIIQKGGFADLIQRMENKLASIH